MAKAAKHRGVVPDRAQSARAGGTTGSRGGGVRPGLDVDAEDTEEVLSDAFTGHTLRRQQPGARGECSRLARGELPSPRVLEATRQPRPQRKQRSEGERERMRFHHAQRQPAGLGRRRGPAPAMCGAALPVAAGDPGARRRRRRRRRQRSDEAERSGDARRKQQRP